MTVTVVTSCSSAGWAQYGLRFLDTFHKFWPRNIALHIVSEDEIVPPHSIMSQREIMVWRLQTSDELARKFYDRHKDNLRCRGRDVRPNGKTVPYSFRHDAWKFSKKVFAIKLVADCLVGAGTRGKLIWSIKP